MTRYKIEYGWQTYETTRHKPGVLTHALVLALRGDVQRIEWCGSYEIAARERARVLSRPRGEPDGCILHPSICEVQETSE